MEAKSSGNSSDMGNNGKRKVKNRMRRFHWPGSLEG